MSSELLPARIQQAMSAASPVVRFISDSSYARRREEPGICDFVFGNPHEMPLPGVGAALGQWSTPQRNDWFAYKMSEPPARAAAAAGLRAWRNVPYAEEDLLLTNGAFGGLAVCLAALVDVGDEVIFPSPPWFFYEMMILAAGARPVRVPVGRDDWDLDLGALDDAITPRTRAVIVNSPNNPTGRIYPPATLQALAELLQRASERHGRPIWLLSDEAYSRIVFDGRHFPSPTGYYPHSVLIYTYGKTLLTPGQRLGFLALPPELPARPAVRDALLVAQLATGWAFPNALMQYALPELDKLSLDIAHLQRKRDRLLEGLWAAGYRCHQPEGTFYLLPEAPLADDQAWCELLAQHDVFALPGSVVEAPGTFRLSLTASDAMIERALPRFAEARAQAVAR